MPYQLYSNEDIRNALRAIEAARAGIDPIKCMAMAFGVDEETPQMQVVDLSTLPERTEPELPEWDRARFLWLKEQHERRV